MYLVCYKNNGQWAVTQPYNKEMAEAVAKSWEYLDYITNISVQPLPATSDISCTDPLTDTVNWFRTATPNPTSKNISTQIGCMLEEDREFLEEIHVIQNSVEVQHPEYEGKVSVLTMLELTISCLHLLAECFKEHNIAYLPAVNRVNALDALCDKIVTIAGVANYTQLDIVKGLKEVNRSNYSKFDTDGTPIRNPETQKIIKGPNYTAPNLLPFV